MADLDKEYVKRMEDLLNLYARPVRAHEPVVCLDEKPVQLLADVRRVRGGLRCGRIQRRDYEYRRCGVENIFCALEPKAGRHFNRVTRNRGAREFAKMMRAIARRYRRARKIHIDNVNTHCEKSMVRSYGRRVGQRIWRRFQLHPTPKHGSWLNQAEIEVGRVSRQVLGSGSRRICKRAVLRDEIRAFNTQANRERRVIHWKFTTRKARRTFGYKCKIARSEH